MLAIRRCGTENAVKLHKQNLTKVDLRRNKIVISLSYIFEGGQWVARALRACFLGVN